jgi:hypothetical protein
LKSIAPLAIGKESEHLFGGPITPRLVAALVGGHTIKVAVIVRSQSTRAVACILAWLDE